MKQAVKEHSQKEAAKKQKDADDKNMKRQAAKEQAWKEPETKTPDQGEGGGGAAGGHHHNLSVVCGYVRLFNYNHPPRTGGWGCIVNTENLKDYTFSCKDRWFKVGENVTFAAVPDKKNSKMFIAIRVAPGGRGGGGAGEAHAHNLDVHTGRVRYFTCSSAREGGWGAIMNTENMKDYTFSSNDRRFEVGETVTYAVAPDKKDEKVFVALRVASVRASP